MVMSELALPTLRSVTVGAAKALYPLVTIVGLWWLTANAIDRPAALPSPAATLSRAGELWSTGVPLLGVRPFGHEFATTVSRILMSFALALVIGVTLGLLIGRIGWVSKMLRPMVSFAFPVPKLAIYPGLVIAFGLGGASKVALGFLEALFPILLATAGAASQLPDRLIWSAQSLGMSKIATGLKVVLPATLPAIMTGARVGLVGATIGVFLAELIIPNQGIGWVMLASARRIDSAGVYVAVVAVSVLGFVADRLLLATRRHLLRWSTEEDNHR